MSKETLIKISSYSGIIGMLLIIISFMILDIELPYVNQISSISQIFGFILFGIYLLVLLYGYVKYNDERINEGKPF